RACTLGGLRARPTRRGGGVDSRRAENAARGDCPAGRVRPTAACHFARAADGDSAAALTGALLTGGAQDPRQARARRARSQCPARSHGAVPAVGAAVPVIALPDRSPPRTPPPHPADFD